MKQRIEFGRRSKRRRRLPFKPHCTCVVMRRRHRKVTHQVIVQTVNTTSHKGQLERHTQSCRGATDFWSGLAQHQARKMKAMRRFQTLCPEFVNRAVSNLLIKMSQGRRKPVGYPRHLSQNGYGGGACGVVWCGVVCGEAWHAENLPMSTFKTPPCVRSGRLRVYRQRARMSKTCGPVAGTHGDVLTVHTEAF